MIERIRNWFISPCEACAGKDDFLCWRCVPIPREETVLQVASFLLGVAIVAAIDYFFIF